MVKKYVFLFIIACKIQPNNSLLFLLVLLSTWTGSTTKWPHYKNIIDITIVTFWFSRLTVGSPKLEKVGLVLLLIVLAACIFNDSVGDFGLVGWVSEPNVVVFLNVFFKWRVVFALLDVVPIYRPEKWVGFHLLQSEAFRRVFLKQADEEISELLGYLADIVI